MGRLSAPSRTLVAVMALILVVSGLAASAARAAVHAADTSGSTASGGGGTPGYWLVGADGSVYQYGTPYYGDARSYKLARPIVGGAATDDGLGYWLAGSDGGIFTFGDAAFHGSTGGMVLDRPIVGMAADPATGGYWMVASDGGIFAFDAPFYGSTGGLHLNEPVVGMAPTPDGHGYWLVASDGGIFAFGDAGFYGSTGNLRLTRPVVSMAATPDGHGYWLVASDGGIFAFGDAGFHGSAASSPLVAPVVSMGATPSGGGYWMAAADGGVFNYGDAPFLGTAPTNGSPPIVAMLSTGSGYPLPPQATGYDVSKFQCPPYGSLPAARAFAMVEIAGNINGYENPCYSTEAAWAGPNMAPYIFMNPLPSPAPTESLSGPAGTCNGDVTCEAYNFGYYWAAHWVNRSESLGYHRTLWWLDVEFAGGWSQQSSSYPANDAVISGAVAGLRASGVVPGIYATSYQWGLITGDQLSFPRIPIWEAGASSINDSGDPYSATAICAGQVPDHTAFAGGNILVVQYGWGSSGETQPVDPDYVCPAN